jgi:hypothetical protein
MFIIEIHKNDRFEYQKEIFVTILPFAVSEDYEMCVVFVRERDFDTYIFKKLMNDPTSEKLEVYMAKWHFNKLLQCNILRKV